MTEAATTTDYRLRQPKLPEDLQKADDLLRQATSIIGARLAADGGVPAAHAGDRLSMAASRAHDARAYLVASLLPN